LESKQKEIRAYKRVMGQQSESSSEDYSESEDENGKKKPPKLDENGNPIIRKKKNLIQELGININPLDMVKNINLANLNPLATKPPKRRKNDEQAQRLLENG
jgi:hypothetical protein